MTIEPCTHIWETEPFTAHRSEVLGTYDTGLLHTCKVCGVTRYERKFYNNYSGD